MTGRHRAATTTPVQLVGELLSLIAATFPERKVHGVGDAAYHGKPLLVHATTSDDQVAGQRRPVRPGPAAHGQAWPARAQGRQARQARCPGRTRRLAEGHGAPLRAHRVRPHRRGAWYGSFGNAAGRCVLVRDEESGKAYDLALFTLDAAATTAQAVERYAVRWSIEPSNATGKQQMGVGQARNRVAKAVERTVPFGMLIQSMVSVWYALHGHHPDDITARRLAEPW